VTESEIVDALVFMYETDTWFEIIQDYPSCFFCDAALYNSWTDPDGVRYEERCDHGDDCILMAALELRGKS
jgi:hypothetical protein